MKLWLWLAATTIVLIGLSDMLVQHVQRLTSTEKEIAQSGGRVSDHLWKKRMLAEALLNFCFGLLCALLMTAGFIYIIS